MTTFWAKNNPPGVGGGDSERNCVVIKINDANYGNKKNWVAQRCDYNESARDSFAIGFLILYLLSISGFKNPAGP